MFNLFKRKDKPKAQAIRQAPRFLTLIGDKGESYVFMRRDSADWNNHETVHFIAPDLKCNDIREYEFSKPPKYPDKWRESTEAEINQFSEDILKVYCYRYEASRK